MKPLGIHKAIFSLFFLLALKINAQSLIRDYSELPIKPERTISFSTKEASYIDVDISPDGKTLVCSFLGEIFTIPAAGGKARQLTRGLAINMSPAWSPDGKYIAYLSDATGMGRLHVMDTVGNFHKVLGEDRNQQLILRSIWLPDSMRVINNSSIIYDITGVHPAAKNNRRPSMSDMVGVSGDFGYCVSNDNGVFKLIKFDRNTGDKIILFEFRSMLNVLEKRSMRISPNGRWVSYLKYNSGSLDSLLVIDLTNNEQNLIVPLNIQFAPEVDHNFCFSKDSNFIYIGYEGKIHRIAIETGENIIIPFVADVKIDMGRLNYNTSRISLDPFQVKYIRSVNRSPNGKHIIFSALNRIYIKELPNGLPRVLVNQNVGQFHPAYSPDGNWIAYITWNETEGGHLWKVRSVGGTPEQITDVAGLYQHPSWSQDGKNILLKKGIDNLEVGGNEAQIQVISLEDKSVRLITESVSKEIHKEVLLSAYVDKKLLPSISLIVPSPDGKNIAFLYNENLYLVPLINARNPEATLSDTLSKSLIRFARGVCDPVWEEGGKIISWVSANKYCRIDPNKIINAAKGETPNKSYKGLPESNIIDVDLPVDIVNINLKAPCLYGQGIIALTNARIITMHNKDVFENGIAIVKDGRFVYVGESGKIKIPREAKVLDLKGKSIIPGFIDMHSHMKESSPTFDITPQQPWQRRINLLYGITTARNPSAGFEFLGHSELIEAGESIGPRFFSAQGRVDYTPFSLHEANIIVSNRVKMGASVIKQYGLSTKLERQLLLQASRNAGINMTNEGDRMPMYWLGMVKDGSTGIEHNPTWGDVHNDFFTLIQKSGTYITPTLQTGEPNCNEYFHKLYGQTYIDQNAQFLPENLKSYLQKKINEIKLDTSWIAKSRINTAINKAGGKIMMGSHGEYQGIGAHYEIWALQMGGLSNYEALKTATITAAEGLGMQKDLGSIEPGKIADLIILDKNPLEDIRNTNTIQYVMKAGVLYESKTLKQVWPEKKKTP